MSVVAVALSIFAVMALACSREAPPALEATMVFSEADSHPPEFVFIPGEGYKIDVEITLPQTVLVGERFVLRASRHSGPWTRVPFKDVAKGTTWLSAEPLSEEVDVADNLSWITDPPLSLKLEIPTHSDYEQHVRTGYFTTEGSVKVWARNVYPSVTLSNIATVTVREK